MNTKNKSRLPWVLLIGDILVLLLFAFSGRREHSEALSVTAVVETSLPFIIGWCIVAAYLKGFTVEAVRTPLTAFKKVLLVWVIACPIGLGIRALFLQRAIPLAFAIVAFVVILLFMLVWRIGFSLVWKRLR